MNKRPVKKNSEEVNGNGKCDRQYTLLSAFVKNIEKVHLNISCRMKIAVHDAAHRDAHKLVEDFDPV